MSVFGKSVHFSLGMACDPRSQFNFYALVLSFISFVSEQGNKQPKTFWSVPTSDAHGGKDVSEDGLLVSLTTAHGTGLLL